MFYNPTDSGAVQLTSANLDMTLGMTDPPPPPRPQLTPILTLSASNELVLINFYADWCRFSNMLAPIYDEAADLITKEFPEQGKVVIGKVDCDKETSIASRFQITKYPTLKLIRNGQPAKREYRGQRAPEAFLEHIKKQLEDPIKEFGHLRELEKLDTKKRIIVGYFDRRDMPEYDIFRRVATNLKEDCHFHVGFGDVVAQMHPPGRFFGFVFHFFVVLF